MNKLPEPVKNLAVFCAALTALFLILEIVSRILAGTVILQRGRNDSDYIQYDKYSGYVYSKNRSAVVTSSDYKISISINSLGYRDDEWDTTGYCRKILAAGDSYTAGFGVKVNERWSDVLEGMLNKYNYGRKYEIYNAAVSGYNLEQICKTIYALIPSVKPEYVIVGFYIDAVDRLDNPYVYYKGFSIRKNKLDYASIDDDELLIYHFKSKFLQKLEYPLLKYSVFYNQVVLRIIRLKNKISSGKNLHKTGALLKKSEGLLLELNNRLKQTNMKLIVLPVIQHNDEGVFEIDCLHSYDELTMFCKYNEIKYEDILLHFRESLKKGKRFWINKNSHWNPAAHHIAANALYTDYFKKEYSINTPK
jgi:hypothetical protein